MRWPGKVVPGRPCEKLNASGESEDENDGAGAGGLLSECVGLAVPGGTT